MFASCKSDPNMTKLDGLWVVDEIEIDEANLIRPKALTSFTKKGNFNPFGKWKTVSSDTIEIVFKKSDQKIPFKVYYFPKKSNKPSRVYLESIGDIKLAFQLKRSNPNLDFFDDLQKQRAW